MELPEFVPGLELSQRYYFEAVRPILDLAYPGLPHAAAHVGNGSDVLGFDTPMSRDHDWGPTVKLFLRDEDAALAPTIHELLRQRLPSRFYGYPTGMIVNANDTGTRRMNAADEGPVEHLIVVTTVRNFAQYHLQYDIDAPLEPADWLSFPAQQLRTLTTPPVFHDGAGALTALRERLAYYPHDVWLFMLASGWQRIGQEEHLMPRAAFAGDELGSAIMGSRLARDVMTLCFLMERVYAPYPKWFGSAFAQLTCAADLTPTLRAAQTAATWQEREAALVPAYEYIARMHNALNLTDALPDRVSHFFGRPFRVIWGSNFAAALQKLITDPAVGRIPRLIGSIDQFSDSTDLHDPALHPQIRSLYTEC